MKKYANLSEDDQEREMTPEEITKAKQQYL